MTMLTQTQSIETPAQRINRAGWLVLTLALGLVLFSMAQKAYRLILPTDGWAFETGEIGGPDQDRPTYTHNLLDLSSPLQPGDRLLAVENRPFETIYAKAHATQMQAMPNWQAGQTVRYTVERAGQAVTLAVPLYRWPGQVIAWELLTDLSLWATLLLAGVGFFVFLKRPDEWAAYPLLLFSVCLLARNISIAVVDWSLPELLIPAIFPVALFFSNWIFAAVMFPSLLLLTLLFPRPKQFVRQHPRPLLVLLYGPIPALFIIFGPIAPAGWISVLTMALLSLAALAHSFVTVRDPVGRAQMRWAASGLAVMVLGFIPINLSGLGWLPVPFPLWLEEIWFPVMLVFMALGFGVAILRYRLFDIDIIINRALVYGTLTILVIGLYVIVVGYLGALFRTETNLYISLVATGLVAVLFQPARDWLQRGANRLMFGQRDDPVGMLTHLAQRLETVDTPHILPTLVETIAIALKLPYVALQTKQPDGQLKPIAESGRPAGQVKRVPLLYQQQEIGQLLIAPRSPGERLSQADERLLATIAPLIATTLRAVQLSEALQASRREIVTGREEERRRLRRDLHDGLGPVLASLALQADTAQELVDNDPVETKQILAAITQEAQNAVADIRRLVYDLRPPALDELGLVKALRQTTRPPPLQVIVEAARPLPALPAAVEVAAYRITQEAINNAARHGQAKHCLVTLAVADHALHLTITDDGTGLPDNAPAGIGLISMRERVAELGGTVTIQTPPAGGTQIRTCLPLK